jgi:hypothetical protein
MFAVSRGRSPTDSVILALAVASSVLAALQLCLGTSAIVVFALLGTTLVSLVPVHVYRLSHIVGALYLLLLLLRPDNGPGAGTVFRWGYALVVVGTLVSFGVTSAVLAATCGSMTRNVFAIYIIARYGHVLVCGVSTTYVYFITRQLTFDVLVFVLAVRFLNRTPAGAAEAVDGRATLQAS